MTVEGERVGVIVIHGVGDTEAGWTRDHLFPRMEHWAAHQAIGQPAEYQDEHVPLRLHCSDGDLRVYVTSDQVFVTLCRMIGAPELIEEPAYASAKGRLENRDFLQETLVHRFVSNTKAEWMQWLREAGVPVIETYSRASGVHDVRDPGSSKSFKSWKSFARQWHVGGREVLFSELFWADMSRVGYTIPSRFFALLQLFLESPYILGQAMLKDSRGGLFGLAKFLIMAAIWLMRWPIAGLNVAVFVPAILAIIFIELSRFFAIDTGNWLPVFVVVVLLALAFVCSSLHRRMLHRKVGLSDLSLAGVYGCAFMLFLLLIGLARSSDGFGQPDKYLMYGVTLVIFAWLIWSAVTTCAIAVLGLIWLKRLTVPFGRTRQRLARPAAALSLTLILGIVLKLILPVLGLFVIALLVPNALNNPSECPMSLAFTDAISGMLSPLCALAAMKPLLLAVSLMNGVSILLVLVAIGGVYSARASFVRRHPKGQPWTDLRLPRVIASKFLVAMLFSGALLNFNAIVVFGAADFGIVGDIFKLVEDFPIDPALAIIGLIIFGFLLSRIVEASDNFVHVGRDLVDHQYDPKGKEGSRSLPSFIRRRRGLKENARIRFRRRLRIQWRLEALINEVVAYWNVDRLIFVAHSQGTVIMHDYLMNHDDLLRRLHETDRYLYNLKKIDVVTVGSPLNHLYRHYFHDYDRDRYTPKPKNNDKVLKERPENLMSHVASWTNMWRADDPVGQDIDLPIDFPINNIGLAPGGHVDYWKEHEVCQLLWGLIHDAHMRRK